MYYPLVRRLIPDIEYHQNRYARELDPLVAQGVRWLDLGAGRRVHGGWLGPRPTELVARGVTLIGCDLDTPHMRANRALSAACVANGKWLPFDDGSFDLVTANMVLEHLPSPLPVFAEVARVLRPGGTFVFLTPNRGHPAVWLAAKLVGRSARRRLAEAIEHRAAEHVFPTFYRANTVAELRRIAAAASLQVRLLECFSSYPLIRGFAPLTAVECLWIRASAWGGLAGLRSNILGCLQAAPPGTVTT